MKFKKAAALFIALIGLLSVFPALRAEVSAESGAEPDKVNPETASYTASSGYVLNYLIYRSPSYDKHCDSKPAMLILCFPDDAGEEGEDGGASGDRLISKLISEETEKLYADYRYIVAVPQCPKGETFVLADGSEHLPANRKETEIMAASAGLIQEIQATEILFQPLKVLAVGAGSGATAAYDFACRYSENVSGVLAVGGVCDPRNTALLYSAGVRFFIFAESGNQSVNALVSEVESKFDETLHVNFTEGSFDDCLNYALNYSEPTIAEWAIKENYLSKKFRISASCNAECGQIDVSPKSVPYGGSAVVTITLNSGCAIKSVKVNGVETDANVFSRSEENERLYTYEIKNITQEKSVTAVLVRTAEKGAFSDFTDKLILFLAVVSALFIAAACVISALSYHKKRSEQ